jgi:hypothetical protein
LKVINLLAGPCAGKSTLAAFLFGQMKRQRYNVELVNEYAKDLVWEGRMKILKDQMYVLAKQNNKLERLKGNVDFAISDSPLLLCNIYAGEDYFPFFKHLCWNVWESYDNIVIFVDRPPHYDEVGRYQDHEGAKAVDEQILTTLKDSHIPYIRVPYDVDPEALIGTLGI